jgi:hypothetical protein
MKSLSSRGFSKGDIMNIRAGKYRKFKRKRYVERKMNIKKLYNSTPYADTPEEEAIAYEKINNKMEAMFKEISEDYQSAVRLGADERELMKSLSSRGFSKGDIMNIRAGKYRKFKRKRYVGPRK